jgi:SAM-dependent methyltransferase
MELTRLQKNWETLAQQDPMWAIISDPNKKGRQWDSAAFFQSGEAAIDHLFLEIAQLNFSLRSGTALDFGCGLGRLTQGICKRFAKTYGIDISPTMVAEAARYNRYGSACEYVVNDSNDLRRFDNNAFDFICSSLVLQHIQAEASKIYMAEFMRVLKPGGLLFFQLPSVRRETRAEGQGPAEKTWKRGDNRSPLARPENLVPGSACGRSLRAARHLAARGRKNPMHPPNRLTWKA